MNRLLLVLLLVTLVGVPQALGQSTLAEGQCDPAAMTPAVLALLQQLVDGQGVLTSQLARVQEEMSTLKSQVSTGVQAPTGGETQTPTTSGVAGQGVYNVSGESPAADCSDIPPFYYIYPAAAERVAVQCDHAVNGGGWTLIQQRVDGSVDFYRTWVEYEAGFGDRKEFWLGNAALSRITAQKSYMLRIELEDFEGESRYAEYDYFRVGGAEEKYKLYLGTYSGDAGDAMTHRSANSYFSTRDRDHDLAVDGSCANWFKGGWWYGECHHANLNGLYLAGNHTSWADGIEWGTWHGYYYSLKAVRMMIRPTEY